ncbi:MAG: hypothetical protein H0U35_13215, partial [Sporichthyaceae bacterium]|nr:hypothetical protein [Sporichthyaceae bacterium]
MAAGNHAVLQAGADAVSRGEWMAATAAYREAIAVEPSAEGYDGLGTALWWLGDVGEAMRCWEAAYAGFRRRQESLPAALTDRRTGSAGTGG